MDTVAVYSYEYLYKLDKTMSCLVKLLEAVSMIRVCKSWLHNSIDHVQNQRSIRLFHCHKTIILWFSFQIFTPIMVLKDFCHSTPMKLSTTSIKHGSSHLYYCSRQNGAGEHHYEWHLGWFCFENLMLFWESEQQKLLIRHTAYSSLCYNISSNDAISSLWAFMSIWFAIWKWIKKINTFKFV